MCGIVGLYLKNPALEPSLGRHLSAMLASLGDRGPDSAGFAIYRDPVPEGAVKLTLFHSDEDYDWAELTRAMAASLGVEIKGTPRASHFVLIAATATETARRWIALHRPDVRIMGIGQTIELYKEKGLPAEVVRRFKLDGFSGSHALGHTRMATESAVTTQHSHPFSTGLDLCLVHNGSLSNHNRLRQWLNRRGVEFQTDNDTEVAAGYFTYRLSQGASLAEALEAGLVDLDGFYTFAIGTRDGFAVLRDSIACKPAVLAETDDWVAMASEYRAIAHLPGADSAAIWEPAPATVYSWTKH
ncbi:MAG TPA: glutamine amidotransferase family protein [Alphaproteobacteria bacterium]|nr:glutamine amidotransferase family protein [Alphaproteobacteria bacterium]